MNLAEVRHRIEDRSALCRGLTDVLGTARVFTHPLIPYDAAVPGETDRVLRASEEMLAACVAAGGSLSDEHGIGIEKNNYMPWVFSQADLQAQGRLKAAFDPEGLMNPFKVFPTPVSCGELMAQRAPRLAASGLWI